MSFCAAPRAKCWRQTLKFHSPVSPEPLNARSLRSLGFPKHPPPLKNPRSANVNACLTLTGRPWIRVDPKTHAIACTLAAIGEYSCMIRARRRCGLMSHHSRRLLNHGSANSRGEGVEKLRETKPLTDGVVTCCQVSSTELDTQCDKLDHHPSN